MYTATLGRHQIRHEKQETCRPSQNGDKEWRFGLGLALHDCVLKDVTRTRMQQKTITKTHADEQTGNRGSAKKMGQAKGMGVALRHQILTDSTPAALQPTCRQLPLQPLVTSPNRC